MSNFDDKAYEQWVTNINHERDGFPHPWICADCGASGFITWSLSSDHVCTPPSTTVNNPQKGKEPYMQKLTLKEEEQIARRVIVNLVIDQIDYRLSIGSHGEIPNFWKKLNGLAKKDFLMSVSEYLHCYIPMTGIKMSLPQTAKKKRVAIEASLKTVYTRQYPLNWPGEED